jgi:predicted transcriptional regulator
VGIESVNRPPIEPALRSASDAPAIVTKVESCAGWNSRLAARRIIQFLRRETASSGLGVAQLGLMAQIAAASGDALDALTRRACLDPSTLSRNLRPLERQGLIETANGGE